MAERRGPKPEPLTGHFGLLHPTDYVRACDLKGQERTVIIAGVQAEILTMQGGKRERKPTLLLRSVKGQPLGKRMVVNKTNAKLIARVTGEKDVGKWSGKAITLYPTTCKGARGEDMECIRVRDNVAMGKGELSEEMVADPEPRADDMFEDEGGEPEPPT